MKSSGKLLNCFLLINNVSSFDDFNKSSHIFMNTLVHIGTSTNMIRDGHCRISANYYHMNYFPGYGEVNVRVYI